MAGPLQRHAARFDERNGFLFALLGLIALAREIDGITPWTDREVEGPPSGQRAAQEDPAVCLLLGLIAFRRTVGTVVEEWALAAPAPPAAPPTSEQWPAPGELMR